MKFENLQFSGKALMLLYAFKCVLDSEGINALVAVFKKSDVVMILYEKYCNVNGDILSWIVLYLSIEQIYILLKFLDDREKSLTAGFNIRP